MIMSEMQSILQYFPVKQRFGAEERGKQVKKSPCRSRGGSERGDQDGRTAGAVVAVPLVRSMRTAAL